MALRNGAEPQWPGATHRDRPVRAWDALRDVRPRMTPNPGGRYARLLPSVPEGQNYQYFTERGGGPALFGYRRRYWSFLLKLAKAEPAWTLPANPGPATGPFHWRSRPLAPEEVLRLQTFPSSWKLEGSYREQIRQAGNATPPLLAELLGRALAEQIFGAEFRRPAHPGNSPVCTHTPAYTPAARLRRVHAAHRPARPAPRPRARTKPPTVGSASVPGPDRGRPRCEEGPSF